MEKLNLFISPKPKSQRRSSFFGYDSQEASKEQQANKEIEKYINRLEEERLEWPKKYLINKKKLLDFWKDSEFVKDKSCLTQEQQDYLNGAIDMDMYSKQYKFFVNKLKGYTIKKKWYLENYWNCIELMEDKLIEQELNVKLALKANGLNF